MQLLHKSSDPSWCCCCFVMNYVPAEAFTFMSPKSPFALQETAKWTGDRACSSEDAEDDWRALHRLWTNRCMSPPPHRGNPTLCPPTLSVAHKQHQQTHTLSLSSEIVSLGLTLSGDCLFIGGGAKVRLIFFFFFAAKLLLFLFNTLSAHVCVWVCVCTCVWHNVNSRPCTVGHPARFLSFLLCFFFPFLLRFYWLCPHWTFDCHDLNCSRCAWTPDANFRFF